MAALLLTGCRSGSFPPPPKEVRWRWTEITQAAGVHYRHNAGAAGRKYYPECMGPGVALWDPDSDGDLDLFFPNGAPLQGYRGPRPILPAFYRNRGNGTFAEATDEMGLAVEAYGMGCAVGDYDNDGWPDLYLTTAVGPNRLFHNEQGKRFTEVTQAAGVGSLRWGASAIWADLDHDGDLDLFVTNYIPWTPETDLWCGAQIKEYCRPQEYPTEVCTLYRNEGGGCFTDVTRQAGLDQLAGKSLGVAAWDVNLDGRTDLVVTNDTEPDFLLINQGNLRFAEQGLEMGLALSETGLARSGMGVDVCDLDGDGTWLVAVGNFAQEGLGLYQRQGDGFHDLAAENGMLEQTINNVTFGVAFADFDLDGWTDLWTTNGHIDAVAGEMGKRSPHAQSPHCFRQVAPGRWEEWAERTGVSTLALVGRANAQGDWDGDGDLDLVLTANQGPALLLRNDQQTGHHWLRVRLQGVASNRDGYGALVRVRAGNRWQQQWVNSGRGYQSASDPAPTFGLATRERADEVEVRWPSGRVSRLQAVGVDREIQVTEPRE